MIQLPYIGNCTLYRLCIDGETIIYRCPEGNLYDTEQLRCRPRGEAVCTVEGIVLIAGDLQFEIDQEERGIDMIPENWIAENFEEMARKFAPFRLD